MFEQTRGEVFFESPRRNALETPKPRAQIEASLAKVRAKKKTAGNCLDGKQAGFVAADLVEIQRLESRTPRPGRGVFHGLLLFDRFCM